MQTNDKTTHLKSWLSASFRIVLLITLCCVLYRVQLKWLDFSEIRFVFPAFFLIAILLVPFNLALDWLRFKKSLECAKMAGDYLSNSFFQGLIVSFFTPAILAATVGRMHPLHKEKNASMLFSGFYCGLSQFGITMGFACFGAFFLRDDVPMYTIWCFFGTFVFSVAAMFLSPKYLKKPLRITGETVEITPRRKLSLVGLSLLRYGVFSVQFHVLLQSLGQEFSIHQALVLMISYGLITLTPSILFGKIVVREALAVAVFSAFLYAKEPVFIAAFLTWLFNVIFPLIFATIRLMFTWKSQYS